LELFYEGATQPFAVATIAGCGTDPVPVAPAGKQYRTFCAKMMNEEFVIDDSDWGNPPRVSVRPRISTDTNGAISAEPLTFALLGGAPGVQVVKARGLVSSRSLIPNNGTLTDDGEIMIGSFRTNDSPLLGSNNVVVLSKVVSITNADPNANGTAIPSGSARDIGQFKFTAAAANNGKSGPNKVALGSVLFSVNATNVLLKGDAFAGYSKTDPTSVVLCYAMGPDGTALIGDVTGSFLVSCAFSGSFVNNVIDPGTDATFVLRADLMNAKINNAQASTLQVALMNFSDSQQSSFGPGASHLTWQDQDSGGSTVFRWIESPETTINGTAYAG
jgi:hypothetical protein